MYNKFISALLLTLLFSGIGWGQLRVGVVDTDVILQEHPQLLKQAEAQLTREMEQWAQEKERASWEADMQRLEKDILDREGVLEKGQMLSADKKAKMKAEIDSLRYDFQMRLQSQLAKDQERVGRRRNELIAEVLSIIREIVQQIGEEEEYDLIIDTSGSVVYVRDPEEITDQVLRKLKDR